MTNWIDDPESRAWAQQVLDEVGPMIRDSAATISLVPDNAGLDDIKFAVELGLSIMLDKPIIVGVVPGRQIPAALARVAVEIVELDLDRDYERSSAALTAAIARVLGD